MKRTTKAILVCLSAIAISWFLITSCNKENSNSSEAIPSGHQKVSVTMNDGPVLNFSSVIVDIRYVEVKVDTGKVRHDDHYYDDDHEGDDDDRGDDDRRGDRFGVWDTVGVTPGLYDLVKLQNGIDTLIATGITQAGKITKIRVTLGNNNSISTDSSHHYPLPICNSSPYVYANIRTVSLDSIGNNQFIVHLDFNIARSIRYHDGEYCLKAVIIPYCGKNSGSLSGIVLPESAHAYVEVLNNSDTALAVPGEGGKFKINGLPPGVYSVQYNSVALYHDTTLNNITVLLGEETKLPTITLHP